MSSKPDVLPTTTERVSARTAERVNRRIRQQTEAVVAYFADHPKEIGARLRELDREWDIERVLEANASALAFSGVALAARDRRFLILPALVTGFLLQHALHGWCPPVPILRRCGVRTAEEISLERTALKYLRGDFGLAPLSSGAARDRARQALLVAEA
ncbi:MAG: hypothetical protein ACFCVH_07420 [Alphaproteobacteria bacterium]